MIFSLLIVLGFTHLPLGGAFQGVGWHLIRSPDWTIDLIEAHELLPEDVGSPVTSFERDEENQEEVDEVESDEPLVEDDLGFNQSARTFRPRRMSGLKVYDFAHEMPKVVGGMGAYYIHITYPQSAINAGIQGRLVVSFVVDTVGHTNQIQIVKSLHPDCDSAAVRALRRTRFVPGRQNGELVSVRMRLPVVFKLIEPPEHATEANL